MGLYSSIVYNIHSAESITSAGRSSISTAILTYEAFFADNVLFGSLNEVMLFIDNICKERPNRKYKDSEVLSHYITSEECFAKIILECGYRWIPDMEDLDIIWKTINNLDQEDLNRVYYKNNLYEFLSNDSMIKALNIMLHSLQNPYLAPLKPPKELKPLLDSYVSLLLEYVYYDYMYMDRIDRNKTMIKKVCLISDTDSAFLHLDPFYEFCKMHLYDFDFPIMKYKLDEIMALKVEDAQKIVEDGVADQYKLDHTNPVKFLHVDEFGDIDDISYQRAMIPIEPDYDYNFFNDEVTEIKHAINPIYAYPEDLLRYALVNIAIYTADKVVNRAMLRMTHNSHSWRGDENCKIIMKSEWLMKRVLMTDAKKHYSSYQEVQEGKLVPRGINTALDIKGIDSMLKTTTPKATRDALKKILYDDILDSPEIDQLKVIKHLAILEKKIYQSLIDGDKEYYKPAAIKSIYTYADPYRIQGIKAALCYNALKEKDYPAINLEERNNIDIAKVDLNTSNVDMLKDEFEEVYLKAVEYLKDPHVKGSIDVVAIPLDVPVPKWIIKILDYSTIVSDNVSGFPTGSIGIPISNSNINYSNILTL